MAKNKLNKVSIVMGSQSDYKTMIFCQNILKKLNQFRLGQSKSVKKKPK